MAVLPLAAGAAGAGLVAAAAGVHGGVVAHDVGRRRLSRKKVAEGRSVIDSRIVEILLAAQRRRENSRLDTLTPREQEILALIAQGRSNEAIAERLVITKRAVERHIHSIFWKLDLGDSKDVSRRVKATLLYLAGQVG